MKDQIQDVVGVGIASRQLKVDPVTEHQQGAYARDPRTERFCWEVRLIKRQRKVVVKERTVQCAAVHFKRHASKKRRHREIVMSLSACGILGFQGNPATFSSLL